MSSWRNSANFCSRIIGNISSSRSSTSSSIALVVPKAMWIFLIIGISPLTFGLFPHPARDSLTKHTHILCNMQVRSSQCRRSVWAPAILFTNGGIVRRAPCDSCVQGPPRASIFLLRAVWHACRHRHRSGSVFYYPDRQPRSHNAQRRIPRDGAGTGGHARTRLLASAGVLLL